MLALSPDGQTIVYRARDAEGFQLFRRPVDQFEATPIPGTENGASPFFSPDGQWIAFSQGRALVKVSLVGGPAQTLTTHAGNIRGAEWGPDDMIVYGLNTGENALMRIPASGGEPTTLFASDDGRRAWYPQVLAGGEAVLFTLTAAATAPGELHLLFPGTGEHRTLLPGVAKGRVLSTGHLVFVRGGALWAAAFDSSALDVVGDPAPVLEGVRVEPGGAVQYATADDGSLVYIPGTPSGGTRSLVWVDRTGEEDVVALPLRDYETLSLSPDGTRAAVVAGASSGNRDVWISELARGTLTRLTTQPGDDTYPLWSADGRRVAYMSREDGRVTVYLRAADGSGTPNRLLTDEELTALVPYDWSPDDETLFLTALSPETDRDVGIVSSDGSGTWEPLMQTPAREQSPAISPDGRWLAYASDESGRSEVYVQRFPDLLGRQQVSVDSGYRPRWSEDGRELFYLRAPVGPPTAVVRVAVEATNGDPPALDFGSEEVLFDWRYYNEADPMQYYDVSPDGQRFLMITSNETEGTRALVLELVEGPTLSDRIKRGPIPLDEALPIAKQIAEALEAAHEAGVIHRDLKPANIKVREDGTVKVLDFGLAKALDPSPVGDPSQSPTLTAAATQMGVIMGTAAYMSPEQARGKPVDKRADIWAFGCVLYEMLTGRKAFDGEDVSLALSAVLQREPNWTALPIGVTPALDSFLRRCFAKNPVQRVHDIADMRLALEGAFEMHGGVSSAPVSAAPVRVWQRPAVVVATALAAFALGGLAVWGLSRSPEQSQAVARFSIALDTNELFTDPSLPLVAVSPDGRHVIYAARDQLLLRHLDALEVTPIPGTQDGGSNPFVSYDGEWIGFWAEGALRKVAMRGGAAVTVCDATNPTGVSWGEDDFILFGQGPEGIWRVPGAGGTPEVVIEVEDGEQAHAPQMLPGGDWMLFTLAGRPGFADGARLWGEVRVVVQSLSTGERTVVLEGVRDARYLPTGHLAYAVDGVLLVTPFDVEARQVTGGPVPLEEGIADAGLLSAVTHFDVAPSGALVYVPGTGLPVSGAGGGLAWLDRQGNSTPAVPEWRVFAYPRLSPDDSKVAASLSGEDIADTWIWDFAGGFDTRLTEGGGGIAPAWTPDGASVAFMTMMSGRLDLYARPVDLSSQAELLVTSAGAKSSVGWTPDGQTLIYHEVDGNQRDLWTMPLDGDPRPFLVTDFNERAPRLSPDGQWLAYVSDQAGEDRVYVRPFPSGDYVITISAGPGTEPVWGHDGEELFYRDGEQMFAVAISTDPAFRPGRPTLLFEASFAPDPSGLAGKSVAASRRLDALVFGSGPGGGGHVG